MNTTEKLADMLFEARRDITRMEENLTRLAQVISMRDDEIATLQAADIRLDELARLIASQDTGLIHAIKTFRSITGLGLKASKNYMEKARENTYHHGGLHSGEGI